jgi:phage baseplate assembly protein W
MSTGILNPSELSNLSDYKDRYLNDVVYSDIDLRFIPHPVTGDISTVEDIAAVKKALQYLILTKYGTRPFQPNFGSAAANQLFEQMTIDYVSLSESIRRTIQINEPRVIVEQVFVRHDEQFSQRTGILVSYLNDDTNAIHISVTFRVKNFKDTVNLNLTLKRTR